MDRKVPTNTAAAEVRRDWLFGRNPEAIEAQEARGQREAVASDTLPTEGLADVAAACGMKVIGPVDGDEMFSLVEMPPGWTKRATSHAMWNEVVDEKGRARAKFFYKAAFYDRRADIRAVRRFSIGRDYSEGPREAGELVSVVKDGDREVYRTESVKDPSRREGASREDWRESDRLAKAQLEECTAWLTAAGYPDFTNAGAYWE
jgi:hypothetical protein